VKSNVFLVHILVIILLSACQRTPSVPIKAETGIEFTLASGQTATIAGTDLTIKFILVSNDERCPSGIECLMTGPVTLSLSVREGNGSPSELVLQTFTDDSGRSPDSKFQGIQDQASFGGYLIQVKAVQPYPQSRFASIKADDYRVALIVTQP
jgi:hypothetical protein